MNKLQELINGCKAGVYLNINEHKDYYQSVEDHMIDISKCRRESIVDLVPVDVYNKMITLNTSIRITFYPRTPIGSYDVYHYDLDKALDECLRLLKEDK